MVRRCRPLLFCVYACAVWSLLVVLLAPRLALSQTADTIHFRWAFVSRAGATTAPRPLTQDTVLHTGEQFKILVELQHPCFVYVLYHSAGQSVDLLFPATLQQFDTDYVPGKPYAMPPKGGWYTLTPPAGRETIYVLASATRLTALEALLGTAAAAPSAERPALTPRILAAIRALRPGGPVATAGERPARIGGTVRGTTDLGNFAVEVQAQTFYSKSLSIEHR
jgi:hypothetical protein